MKKNSGFTLLELLITVALISIVTAIAVPSMTSFTQNDRLTTNINTLVGHLAYARSEAVKRSQQVSICISSDSATCTGANFDEGWIVYIDADNNGSFTEDTASGEVILRAQQQLEGGNTLTPTTFADQVTYDYRGFATSTGSFLLCDGRIGPHGKTITISPTGRVRLESDSTCS
jgi:type IV fimbrial biogenesis protein FimT